MGPEQLQREPAEHVVEKRVELGEHGVEQALEVALRVRALRDHERAVPRQGHKPTGYVVRTRVRRGFARQQDASNRLGVALV